MALQSNPPLSASEIKAELGSSSNSLLAFGSEAGFNVPFNMSDFLGYSAGIPNIYYIDFDGVNDYVQGSINGVFDFQKFSYNVWVRVDNTTKRNFHFIHHTPNNGNSYNGMLWQYTSSVNCFRAYFYNGSGAKVYAKEYYLHGNSSITGITNSSTGWTINQRGIVDSEGWTMITITCDLTLSSSAAGIEMYWNGSRLTNYYGTQTYNLGGSIIGNFIGVGEWTGNASPSGGSAGGGMDSAKVYSRVLNSTEVAQLYNAGKVDASTAGVTSGLYTEILFEQNVADTNNMYNLVNNGATYRTY
jgi:hypothetical protein